MAVFAPIPSARDSTATAVKVGLSRSCLSPKRKSPVILSIRLPPFALLREAGSVTTKQEFAGFPLQEQDQGGRTHGRVLSGEGEAAGAAIDFESRNGIGALVAGIQKGPRRIDGETARIIAARPLLAGKGQAAGRADG